MNGDVVIVGPLGCHDALSTGAPGTVLTVGADGKPAWMIVGGSGGANLCSLDGEQVSCLMGALDFTQLADWQLADLSTSLALGGELLTDAFGVSLGYLLPLPVTGSGGV